MKKDAGGSGYVPDHGSEADEALLDFDPAKSMAQNITAAVAGIRVRERKSIASVRVMVDTPKTVLVPEEVFNAGQIGDYLRVNNIDLMSSESVAVAAFGIGVAQVRAIIAVDKSAVDALYAEFGADKVRITSPYETAGDYRHILRKKAAAQEYATVYATGENAYITVQQGKWAGLKYCELLPYASANDIVYYMGEISGQFGLSAVYVKGSGAKGLCKSLKTKFKGCKCV